MAAAEGTATTYITIGGLGRLDGGCSSTSRGSHASNGNKNNCQQQPPRLTMLGRQAWGSIEDSLTDLELGLSRELRNKGAYCHNKNCIPPQRISSAPFMTTIPEPRRPEDEEGEGEKEGAELRVEDSLPVSITTPMSPRSRLSANWPLVRNAPHHHRCRCASSLGSLRDSVHNISRRAGNRPTTHLGKFAPRRLSLFAMGWLLEQRRVYEEKNHKQPGPSPPASLVPASPNGMRRGSKMVFVRDMNELEVRIEKGTGATLRDG